MSLGTPNRGRRLMDPLVTIAIPSYNYGQYIGEAIRSALGQTYRNLEVLVLDNASTDDSVAVVRSFDDERVRLIVQPENVGLARNHNDCLRNARGDFVSILASDDRLLPTYVSDVLAFRASHPGVDIAYTSVGITDASGQVLYYFDHPNFDFALSYSCRNELASLLTRDNNMYMTTTLFPRGIFDELGFLDESLGVLLDYEFDVRMAGAGKKFGFLSKPEALIRFHGDNRSGVNRFVKTGNQLREFCSILSKYAQEPFHDALAGYNAELLAMVNNKVNEMQVPFPAEFEAQKPELEPRVKSTSAALARIPAISQATLRGEPLISVVVPYSGRLGYLQRALESLAGQEYGKWEAVVVADRCPDPSPLIAWLGLEDRVHVAETSRKSSGPSAARNLGLGCVNGEVVTYLDDDNRFEYGYFNVLAKAFADPGTAVTAGRSRLAVTDANGDVFATAETDFGLWPDGSVSRVSNRLPLNAVAHRRSCLVNAGPGPFHRGLMVLEDWEFLIRLGRAYRFVPLDVPAVVLCVDVMLREAQVFGRRSSAEWSEFVARLQDIYRGHAPANEADARAREVYAAGLQTIIQVGVNGGGHVGKLLEYARALAGPRAPVGGVLAL